MKISKYNVSLNLNNINYTYNTITKEYMKIEKLDINSNEHLGLVIDDCSDELTLLKYAFDKTYYNSDYLKIMITPTFNCNLNCPYCFESSNSSIPEREDYFQKLNNFIENVHKSYKNIHLNFFGGEPFLVKKSIFEMLDNIAKRGIKNINTSYITNGTLIDKEDIERILKYNCDYIQITIDGDREQHDKIRCNYKGIGSFHKIIENIILLAENVKPSTKIILRVNLYNSELSNISEALSQIHKDLRHKINIMFRVVFNTNKFNEINSNTYSNIDEFYEMAVQKGYVLFKNSLVFFPCEAGNDQHSFYLLPDLSLWKCINDMEIKEACIGNLLDNGTLRFNVDNLAYWRLISNPFNDSDCVKCSLLPECLGGCPLARIKQSKHQCREFGFTSLHRLYKDK